MEKVVNIENLRRFAYCNNHLIKGEIKGIIVGLIGLGQTDMYNEDRELWKEYAKQGIVFLVPYQNPWCWMNEQTVHLFDEVLDVLFKEYNLPENLPIVMRGGSMGGLSALTYTAYAKRTPIACVVDCPVCDLVYHFNERHDTARTIYNAFSTYEGTLEEALRTASPIHLIDKLPKETNYYIFHCDEDKCVNKEMHSDRFVPELKKEHKVEYYIVEGRDHCDFPEDIREFFMSIPVKEIESRKA